MLLEKLAQIVEAYAPNCTTCQGKGDVYTPCNCDRRGFYP